MAKNKTAVSWIIFAVYSLITLIGALNHEAWLDEAQAWVIVRDVPLSELPQVLKTEGHPFLWYAVLYPFVKLGFPVEYVSLISWAVTAAGVWVLLFKVELPLPLKAVMLASSGFLYFDPIMLRVYCLIPPILFLILWVYPKRREHAVLYGLLIALLANTHVFICGIVGMLGIFMLYELFSEWRKSSKSGNVKKLLGLGIAGAGVLALVVPLIGSIGRNSAVSLGTSDIGLSTVFWSIPDTIDENILCVVLPNDRNSIWYFILTLLIKLAFIAVLILLRHWRRAFLTEIGFLFFYYVTCGLIWVNSPNRAAFIPLSLAFSFCMAQYEKPVFKKYKLSERGGAVRRFIGLLIRADKNAEKVYAAILFALFAVSVPSGIAYWSKDLTRDFSGAKKTARYVSENFDDDAVFVHLGAGMPELSFYDPGIKIFSVCSNDFETYSRWEYMYEPRSSADEVIEALSEYDKLYIVYYYTGESSERENTFFVSDGMREYVSKNAIALCGYSSEEVRSCLEFIEENNNE